jgi:hypothetical protein
MAREKAREGRLLQAAHCQGGDHSPNFCVLLLLLLLCRMVREMEKARVLQAARCLVGGH